MPTARRAAPPFTKARLGHLHAQAEQLRAQAGVGPDKPLDPFVLAERSGVEVRWTEPQEQDWEVQTFSGGAVVLPDGKKVVLLNHNQSRERANATLMEELSHLHYGHPTTSIGAAGRGPYDPEVEQEAYQTGAAALLPARAIAMAVYKGEAFETIAARYGTSVELVQMRVKVLGLWGRRRGRADGAAA